MNKPVNPGLSPPRDARVHAVRQARLGLIGASIVFAFVSVAHLARFWLGADLQIGRHMVSLEASAVVLVFTAGMGLWLWKLALALGRSGATDPRPGSVPMDAASPPRSAQRGSRSGVK